MLTINMFFQTSLPPQQQAPTTILNIVLLVIAFFVALILKGRFWRYAIVVGFETILAILTVLIFPIMEMLLEEIINEKLKRVGEKVRAHTKRLEMEMKKMNSVGNKEI